MSLPLLSRFLNTAALASVIGGCREIPAAMAYLDAADILAAEQHLSLFLNSTIVHSTLALAENRATWQLRAGENPER